MSTPPSLHSIAFVVGVCVLGADLRVAHTQELVQDQRVEPTHPAEAWPNHTVRLVADENQGDRVAALCSDGTLRTGRLGSSEAAVTHVEAPEGAENVDALGLTNRGELWIDSLVGMDRITHVLQDGSWVELPGTTDPQRQGYRYRNAATRQLVQDRRGSWTRALGPTVCESRGGGWSCSELSGELNGTHIASDGSFSGRNRWDVGCGGGSEDWVHGVPGGALSRTALDPDAANAPAWVELGDGLAVYMDCSGADGCSIVAWHAEAGGDDDTDRVLRPSTTRHAIAAATIGYTLPHLRIHRTAYFQLGERVYRVTPDGRADISVAVEIENTRGATLRAGGQVGRRGTNNDVHLYFEEPAGGWLRWDGHAMSAIDVCEG